jgi:phospholipase C
MATDDPGTDSPPPDETEWLFDLPEEQPERVRTGGRVLRPAYITAPGRLSEIDHIVVLMMENRSFDQVLGYLSKDAGNTDVDGLSPNPEDTQQFNQYPYPNGRIYRPYLETDTAWPSVVFSGPCHDYDCVIAQITDGMKQFVSNFAKRTDRENVLRRIMGYYGPEQLKAYAELTSQFAICDRWFCSHPGPTWPNRFVMFTGDLNRDGFGNVELDNPDLARFAPVEATTLFDHLTQREISWRCYEHGYGFIRVFTKYSFDYANVVPFEDTGQPQQMGFVRDALAGNLPQVTLIDPDYIELPPGNDDHAPANMADGQLLIAKIVSALVRGPLWDRTLLLITYDEHGGFYDHVHPEAGSGGLPQLLSARGMPGPRVPAFVVSPLVRAGYVSHTVYDHTSIGATILRRFCSPRPPRMSPRMDAAKDVRDALTVSLRPRSEFVPLLEKLDVIIATSVSSLRTPNRRVVKPKEEDKKDDFHALWTYGRLMLGRRPR